MFWVVSICHSVNMDGEGSLYGILALVYLPTSVQVPGSSPPGQFQTCSLWSADCWQEVCWHSTERIYMFSQVLALTEFVVSGTQCISKPPASHLYHRRRRRRRHRPSRTPGTPRTADPPSPHWRSFSPQGGLYWSTSHGPSSLSPPTWLEFENFIFKSSLISFAPQILNSGFPFFTRNQIPWLFTNWKKSSLFPVPMGTHFRI